jgi:hypothetical protein
MITLVQSLNDNIKQRIAIAKYNVWFEAWKIWFYSIFNFDIDDLKYKFNPFSQHNLKIITVHHFVCFVFCSKFLHLIWCHRNSSNEKTWLHLTNFCAGSSLFVKDFESTCVLTFELTPPKIHSFEIWTSFGQSCLSLGRNEMNYSTKHLLKAKDKCFYFST